MSGLSVLTVGAAAALAGAFLWALAVAILLFRAVTQMRRFPVIGPDDRAAASGEKPRIAVIVPVRDEAPRIGQCLAGLVAQDYPADRFAITVVDDNSRDGSAALVGALAQRVANLSLLPGRALPGGWAGKPFACWQAALASDAEWLCFIDADTRAEPSLLRRAVGLAAERRLDMLSLEPFQELGTFWERLIIPTGLFALACACDVRRTTAPDRAGAAVNGQFLLIRRAAYFSAGGHAAVRAEISEDSALATRVKGAGYRLGLFGADGLIRTRMYDGLGRLWEGLSKNVTEVFGGAAATLAVAAGALLFGWGSLLVPLAVALVAFLAAPGGVIAAAAIALAAAASTALVATQIALARHCRIPPWYGLLFPLSCTAAALLAFYGTLSRARGRVAWKGRIYPAPRKARRAPR